jgi:hypothetical protein
MRNVHKKGSVQFQELITTIPMKIRNSVYYIRSEQGNVSFFDINQTQFYQKCTECYGVLPIEYFDIHRKPDPPKLDLEKSILVGRVRTKCRICNGSRSPLRTIGGSVIQRSQSEFRELLNSFNSETFFNEFKVFLKTLNIQPPPGEIKFPSKILIKWKSELKRNVINSLRSNTKWEDRILEIYNNKVIKDKRTTFLEYLDQIKEKRVTSRSRSWIKSFINTTQFKNDQKLNFLYTECLRIRDSNKNQSIKSLKEKIRVLEEKKELNNILQNFSKKTRDLIKKVSPKKVKFYTIDNELIIKKCPGCNEYKGIYDYTLTKNGYSTRCNKCKVILTRTNRLGSDVGTGKKGEIYKGRVIKKYDSNGNIVQRRCTSCDEFKPVKKFSFRKRSSVCDDCFIEIPNNYLTRKGEYYKGELVRIYDPKTNNIIQKKCSKCKKFKELNDFYLNRMIRGSIDYRSNKCKSCSLEERLNSKKNKDK